MDCGLKDDSDLGPVNFERTFFAGRKSKVSKMKNYYYPSTF